MYLEYPECIINDMPIQIGQRPDHGFDDPLRLLSDCHRHIEYFLRVLIAVDERLAGGILTPAQRADLEAALRYFETAAPKHTADEEKSLFPRLRETRNAAAAHAFEVLARLERDHDEAEQHHRAIDTLGRRWLASGSLDPVAAGALRAHLAALQAIYQHHIDVEDRELFPTAARMLSSSQLAEVGREMAARRARTATR